MSLSSILPFNSSGNFSSDGPSKPRVLWNNLMATGSPSSVTPSVDPDPVNYSYQNCYDSRSYTYWKVTAGTQYLTFVFPSGKAVTAYGIYSPGDETLGSTGGTIQLQYSQDGGGSWLDWATAEAPIDNTPIYRSGDSITAARWRWKIITSVDVYIAMLSFGADFAFERGCHDGFSPPYLARATILTNNVSQAGNWLGRSIIRDSVKFSFNMDFLTESFVRTDWHDFVVWAEQKAWFLLWNKDQYPADACICWVDESITPPAYSHPNFMNAKMMVKGRIN